MIGSGKTMLFLSLDRERARKRWEVSNQVVYMNAASEEYMHQGIQQWAK